MGTFPVSLATSKLRSAGWAPNVVDIAGIAVWDRCLSWTELQGSAPAHPLTESELETAQILGRVTDCAGNPLSNVSVKWKEAGCSSDEEGCFQLDLETDVPDTASQASSNSTCISFQCDGYAPTCIRHDSSQTMVVNAILRPVCCATIQAEEGGLVEDSTGSSLTVPSNALAYADGAPVTGPVTLQLSVIDVTDAASLKSMPGDFSALMGSGEEVMLESLGAAWINATDAKGEELSVRGDSEADSFKPNSLMACMPKLSKSLSW